MKIKTVISKSYEAECDCGAMAYISSQTFTLSKGKEPEWYVAVDCPACYRQKTFTGPDLDNLRMMSDCPSFLFNEEEARENLELIENMLKGVHETDRRSGKRRR